LRWWEKLNSLPEKPKPPPGWVALEVIVPRKHVGEVRRVVEALYPPPKPAESPASKATARASRSKTTATRGASTPRRR
jgi:hypothetical protein